MLCHVYELKHEISVFVEKKGAEVPAFTDTLWMCDFAFNLRNGAPHSAERQTTEKCTVPVCLRFRDQVSIVGNTTAGCK